MDGFFSLSSLSALPEPVLLLHCFPFLSLRDICVFLCSCRALAASADAFFSAIVVQLQTLVQEAQTNPRFDSLYPQLLELVASHPSRVEWRRAFEQLQKDRTLSTAADFLGHPYEPGSAMGRVLRLTLDVLTDERIEWELRSHPNKLRAKKSVYGSWHKEPWKIPAMLTLYGTDFSHVSPLCFASSIPSFATLRPLEDNFKENPHPFISVQRFRSSIVPLYESISTGNFSTRRHSELFLPMYRLMSHFTSFYVQTRLEVEKCLEANGVEVEEFWRYQGPIDIRRQTLRKFKQEISSLRLPLFLSPPLVLSLVKTVHGVLAPAVDGKAAGLRGLVESRAFGMEYPRAVSLVAGLTEFTSDFFERSLHCQPIRDLDAIFSRSTLQCLYALFEHLKLAGVSFTGTRTGTASISEGQRAGEAEEGAVELKSQAGEVESNRGTPSTEEPLSPLQSLLFEVPLSALRSHLASLHSTLPLTLPLILRKFKVQSRASYQLAWETEHCPSGLLPIAQLAREVGLFLAGMAEVWEGEVRQGIVERQLGVEYGRFEAVWREFMRHHAGRGF